MANIKVSELVEANEFTDNDYTMIVQSNANKKISKANMLNGLASQTEINNLKGQILWTNPNPTSDFSAQAITLSSNNYDMYEVIYYSSITQAVQMTTGKIKKGENLYLTQTYYDAQVRVRQREVIYNSDLSLNVQEAKNNGSTQNTDLIPIYVIGYKTGLFN